MQKRSLGLLVSVSCFGLLLAGSVTPANALSARDQDRAIDAYRDAFYTETDGAGNFVRDDVRRGYPGGGDFWRCAEEIEMVEDAYNRSGNPIYRRMIDALYRGFVRVNGADWMGNHYNDDLMWITIACLRAYRITGNVAYYDQAKRVFDNVWDRAYDDSLGGGLWWSTDNRSKNACVNGPAAIAAMLLYRCGAGEDYLEKARAVFFWEVNTLYRPDGVIADNISARGRVNGGATTYNQGTFIGAADLLEQATGAGIYDPLAVSVADYTEWHCSGENAPGILRAEYSRRDPNNDCAGFKGIFSRWCCRWISDSGHREYLPWLEYNAQTVFDERNAAGLSWGIWGRRTPDGRRTAWECSSAVAMIQNVPAFTPYPGGIPDNFYNAAPPPEVPSEPEKALAAETGAKTERQIARNGDLSPDTPGVVP